MLKTGTTPKTIYLVWVRPYLCSYETVIVTDLDGCERLRNDDERDAAQVLRWAKYTKEPK